MSNVARRRLVLGFALALVAVLLGALVLAVTHPGQITGAASAGAGTGAVGLAESSGSFTIEGSATQSISPGVSAPLDLSLTNPRDVPVTVTDLSVTLKKVSAPNADADHPCAVGDFRVGQASRSVTVTVGARATSTLSSIGLSRSAWPHVAMLDRPANQDGCKGASLTLGYAASGTLDR